MELRLGTLLVSVAEPTPAAIRMVDWKLIEYFEDRRIELYDLADDIGESNNLATSNLTKTNELDLRLTATGNSGRNPLRLKPQLRPVRRSQ